MTSITLKIAMLSSPPRKDSNSSSSYGSIITPYDTLASEDEEDLRDDVGNTSKFTTTVGLLVTIIIVVLFVSLGVIANGQLPSEYLSSMKAFVYSYSMGSSEKSATSSTSRSAATSTGSTDLGVSGDVPTMQTKPNFVVIVADDLGWNALGYNDEDISFASPIMTNMARKGITMGNFYAQEVCSPSRASLLTGRYPLSSGMQYGMVAATAEWGMSLDEVTIAEVLADNHYSTHMLGKRCCSNLNLYLIIFSPFREMAFGLFFSPVLANRKRF